MGLMLKIVPQLYNFDNIGVIIGIFYSPIHCTLWIIETACFSVFELWKMNLFSRYFISFSFNVLSIVVSIITMITLLLLLLLPLLPPILFLFIMCYLFLLLF